MIKIKQKLNEDITHYTKMGVHGVTLKKQTKALLVAIEALEKYANLPDSEVLPVFKDSSYKCPVNTIAKMELKQIEEIMGEG